jgi:hypothetical protein
LDVVIGDNAIADLLERAQHETVKQSLNLAAAKRNFELTKANVGVLIKKDLNS